MSDAVPPREVLFLAFDIVAQAYQDPAKAAEICLITDIRQFTGEHAEYDPATAQIQIFRNPTDNRPVPDLAAIRIVAANAMKRFGVPEAFHPVIDSVARCDETASTKLADADHMKRINNIVIIPAPNPVPNPLESSTAPHIPKRYKWRNNSGLAEISKR